MKNIMVLGLVALMSVACGGNGYDSETPASSYDHGYGYEVPAAEEASPADESVSDEEVKVEGEGEKSSDLYTITVDDEYFGDWDQEMRPSRRSVVMGHKLSRCAVGVDTETADDKPHGILAAILIASIFPEAVGPEPEVSSDGSAALATFLDFENEVVGKVVVRSIPGTDTYHLTVLVSCPVENSELVDVILRLVEEGVRVSVE